MFLVRISIKKRVGGRFFLFLISYCTLSLHIITLPVGFCSKTLLIKNNKKREAALKNEAGGDKKHVFFAWPKEYEDETADDLINN